jgi:phosphoglycolate phosphatase
VTVSGEPHLVLWDIDHTLIESPGTGRLVYERVFPAVTGQPLRELATMHGRTELDIMHDTLALHDIEPTEQLINQLLTALAAGYRGAIDELISRGRVLPGVREALDALAGKPDVHQSVLTGNTAEVARIKVEAFGLDHYLGLALGAYGDDHRDRAELVAVACERAGRHLGVTINAGQAVLIGDTPGDVRAALTAGARIIAVATGEYTVEDLRAAGAATVTQSLGSLGSLHNLVTTEEAVRPNPTAGSRR